MIKKRKQKQVRWKKALTAAIIAYLMATTPVKPYAQNIENPWQKRCVPAKNDTQNTQQKEQCEIFQILTVKDTGKRFAEFAIFKSPEGKGARGTIILPLGILLSDGIRMRVDEDGKIMSFNIHYCDVIGCVAFVVLDDTVLDTLRKGKIANVAFQSPSGQFLGAQFSLDGFTAAYKDIAQ